MKKILLSLVLFSTISCFARDRNTNTVSQSHSDAVDTEISLEIEKTSNLNPRYRGCMRSSDDLLEGALRYWHKVIKNRSQPSLFIINFGGEYITGIYFVISGKSGNPHLYFPDERGGVKLPENVFKDVMNVAKITEPNALTLDKNKVVQSQHVECRFVIYVEGSESKILSSLSDNSGLDSSAIDKINEPIFRIINNSDER